jgi:hypothetical protein
MSASPVDHVVSDYLNRLDVAARSLRPDRRAELLQEIREHIDAARAAGAAADEATVRTMLDRLGEPEEIVAAAVEAAPPADPVLVTVRPSTGLELAAVLLLTVGSFIPLIGWAVGAVLLWASRRWSIREKLLGTLVVPGGPGMALWPGLFSPGQTCTERQGSDGEAAIECTGFSLSPWIGVPLFLAILFAPFVVAGLLYSRARDRAAAEAPELRPTRPVATSSAAWTGQEIATVLVFAVGGILTFIFSPLGVMVALVAAALGLTLAWTSRRWERREQLTATVMVGATTVGVVALGAVVLLVEGSGTARFPLLVLLPIGLALGQVAAAVYLTIVLNRRRPGTARGA